ncbi:MAG: hypothetical protein E6L04_10120 [Thaumarchaeota archaeon]|nr:MAG: hypothetical protein E6L04_10120 [Nitrososphaerota archaeon]TLX87013.1 MAG: hypothetical protein E6K97_09745 [Nitrososphaerota archaeon]
MSDSERTAVETITITMRILPNEALQYLKDCGIEISRRSYFRHNAKLEASKWERLMSIAERFTEQHLQRIDKLELVESLMWKNYDLEKYPHKKVDIHCSIVTMQPFLSNYYVATRFVLERRLKIDPIKKPDIYLGINIDKADRGKQILQSEGLF